jgi:hypothetical protein
MALSMSDDKIVMDLTGDTSSDNSNDEIVIDLPGDTSSDSSGDTRWERSTLSEYSDWPTSDEDDDETAEKIYTCLQGKIDGQNEGHGHFQRTPASELPILFGISDKVRDSVACIVRHIITFNPGLKHRVCSTNDDITTNSPTTGDSFHHSPSPRCCRRSLPSVYL